MRVDLRSRFSFCMTEERMSDFWRRRQKFRYIAQTPIAIGNEIRDKKTFENASGRVRYDYAPSPV